jgi:hypothetical protein
MATPAEGTAAGRRNEPATEVWVHDDGLYRVDHFADHSRPVSFSATLGRVSFSDFLTADQADQLADALKAHAAYVREQGQDESDTRCGRLLMGMGDDTYDPECGLPRGHDGACRPTFLCAECGAEYLRSHPREKYCSDHCRELARVGS